MLRVIGVCLLVGQARAALDIELAIDDVQGEDWNAQGITLALHSPGAALARATIRVARVELPGGHGALSDLRLECAVLQPTRGSGWHCPGGSLRVADSPLQRAQETPLEGYFASAHDWSIRIPRIELGRGQLALAASAQGSGWRIDLTPHRVGVRDLVRLSGAAVLPRDWGIDGRLSGTLGLAGESALPSRIGADLVVDQLNYASPDGRQAAENLLLKTTLEARASGDRWRFEARLAWPRGAFYAEPVFLDAAQSSLQLSASGDWQPARD